MRWMLNIYVEARQGAWMLARQGSRGRIMVPPVCTCLPGECLLLGVCALLVTDEVLCEAHHCVLDVSRRTEPWLALIRVYAVYFLPRFGKFSIVFMVYSKYVGAQFVAWTPTYAASTLIHKCLLALFQIKENSKSSVFVLEHFLEISVTIMLAVKCESSWFTTVCEMKWKYIVFHLWD